MLSLLAETLTIETGALVSVISAAVGAGALKGLDLFKGKRGRVNGEKCEDHEKRLVRIETALDIEVPAMKAAIAELGQTFDRGLTGVHKRLDRMKDGV